MTPTSAGAVRLSASPRQPAILTLYLYQKDGRHMGWDDKRRGGAPGGSGGFDKIPDFNMDKLPFPPIRPYHVVGALLAALGIWLATGLYRVELQEQAVVMIFGKHTKTSGPGLGWAPPSPIGMVIKVTTEEIKRVEVGYRTAGVGASGEELGKERLMLTMGTNIVDIQMSVQYRINDPAAFLFSVADREGVLADMGLYSTVKAVAEAALREVVGNTDIDDVLTVGRGKVESEVLILMQATLDKYKAGITVKQVQLQDVHPPEQVREAFRDVNNAEEDKNRLIREAEGYRNSVIPEARGQAAQIIANAEAFKAEKVAKASGDAQRFEAQQIEYAKAPAITRKRLSLEMMEEVLAGVDKIVVDPSVRSVLPLLNLDGKKVEVAK
ncbi:MAG: FtsH protease activity modulator HflK [Nitrospinae bacterium]|nr:FtsH protease activity modulator HflK [Nitrospinota bacterium]